MIDRSATKDSARSDSSSALPARQLVDQWRAMVANAFREGPIPGDEIGHMARWTAVEMCADELEAAALKLGEWQLIETAPKDGTWVLGFGDGWGIADRMVWSRASNCWVFIEGEAHKPSHWMPLPAPPALAALL